MSQEQNLTNDGGVKKVITKEGSGESPQNDQLVIVHYTGKLKSNNKVFDSSRERNDPFEFVLGQGDVIKGWEIAVASMKKGEQATVTLQPDYGYGKKGASPDIPPNAALVFDIELIDFKKQSSLEEDAIKNLIETQPPVVVERVRVLQLLNAQRDEIEEQENKEIAEVQKKYEALFAPFYVKRAEIVRGTKEVTDDDKVLALEKYPFSGANEANDTKGVPQFWLNALKHSELEALVQPHDEDALKSLVDITTETKYDEKGNESEVTLTFHFLPNEYFENDVLTRTFEIKDEDIAKQTASPIRWKPSKNLSVKIVEKKQRKKGGAGNKAQTRVVKKEEPQDTFFSFFTDIPTGADGDDEGDDDYMLHALAEENWNIAQTIKNDLIPDAVNYYLGLVPIEEGGDEEDYMDGEDDEDDDE